MQPLLSLSESIKLFRTLKRTTHPSSVKVAILSSFTLKGIKETLAVQLDQIGVSSKIYLSNYKQYAQDILNPQSKLYEFKPDIIFLFIDTMTLVGDDYFLPYRINDKSRKKWVKDKLKELQNLIDTLTRNTKAKIVVHNFSLPTHSPLSVLENKQEFGFHESIEQLNILLRKAYKQNSQVFIFDYERFCSHIGKERILDYSMYYVGDIQVSFDVLPKLCYAYTGYIKPLVSLTKKCIVLDLDNTLWGGVIGEDGLSGIKLGPTPEGRPFWEFQKHLLALFQRGVILAINSKNNLNDVTEVFQKHPHMVLQEKHFAAMQINWNDKATNLRELARELNIGLDSFVFFDDDKVNRALVREQIPEVTVIDLPPNPALYVKTLHGINDFNMLQLTQEDLKKGELYAKQRERMVFEKTVTNLDDFLKGLEIVVTLEHANEFTLPRVSQLTQKTNQFNLTTRRYQQEDIKSFMDNDSILVATVSVSDKFGDNGLTGITIVMKDRDEWRIDTFLLSCRVIGRKVEETLLNYIITSAKKAGAKKVSGEYIPTKKNGLVKDFYRQNGFTLENSSKENEKWSFSTSKSFPKPNLITFISPDQ